MHSVNLLEYIKNWLFLKNLEQNNPFDVVIFEKFDNDELEFDSSINIQTLENLKYDFGVSGLISSFLGKYENILFVLDEFSIIYLLPLLSISPQNITIINLWTWISSYINKDLPETNDIWIISNFDIKIYEPFDLKSFFEILKLDGSKYIRVANKELAMSVFDSNDIQINYQNSLISMTDYGFAWSGGTVLCPWSMTIESILTMDICQKNWKFFDMFILHGYDLQISEEFKNSILRTEKLIVILEQQPNSLYEKVIESKLWEKWLFDTEIKFIYPDLDKISTNMKDYIFEQAAFDANAIAEQILQ